MATANVTKEIADLSNEELDGIITAGPATGRITGINHMMIVVKDYERSLEFYRDLLGFKLIGHTPGRAADPDDRRYKFGYDSIAFFRIADNVAFGLYEIKHAALQAHASSTMDIWPDYEHHYQPTNPFGVDHISFEVPTYDEMIWYKEHLEANGVAVSQVYDRVDNSAQTSFDENWPAFAGDSGPNPWFRDPRDVVLSASIYFYDPDDNPLEISTPSWERG